METFQDVLSKIKDELKKDEIEIRIKFNQNRKIKLDLIENNVSLIEINANKEDDLLNFSILLTNEIQIPKKITKCILKLMETFAKENGYKGIKTHYWHDNRYYDFDLVNYNGSWYKYFELTEENSLIVQLNKELKELKQIDPTFEYEIFPTTLAIKEELIKSFPELGAYFAFGDAIHCYKTGVKTKIGVVSLNEKIILLYNEYLDEEKLCETVEEILLVLRDWIDKLEKVGRLRTVYTPLKYHFERWGNSIDLESNTRSQLYAMLSKFYEWDILEKACATWEISYETYGKMYIGKEVIHYIQLLNHCVIIHNDGIELFNQNEKEKIKEQLQQLIQTYALKQMALTIKSLEN